MFAYYSSTEVHLSKMKKTLAFAGPSAVGKTYIASLLLSTYPELFEQAKLYTTRAPRPGETGADRIFIPEETFSEMAKRGDFVVHGIFGGNHYGFTPESLHPKNKHLLVNIWPWLIPQVSKLDHAVIIGMQAPTDWKSLLIQRMRARGDSEETIAKRLTLIAKDIKDLSAHKAITEAHGKYFVIQDDTTIEAEIIPWIETLLQAEGGVA